MKKKTREGVPAGADGIRFQRLDFQVSFWEVDDYVLGNLLFFSEKIVKQQLERMVLRGGNALYIGERLTIYV